MVRERNDDYALRNKVQEILTEMKSDGTLAEISKKMIRQRYYYSKVIMIKG